MDQQEHLVALIIVVVAEVEQVKQDNQDQEVLVVGVVQELHLKLLVQQYHTQVVVAVE